MIKPPGNEGRYSGIRAFTLVELLVVIAVIGILVALLLPAVQAAREAAWRTTCVNNLRQLALGCIQHEGAIRQLPTGGWGAFWVGDADRGTGSDQPGSWIYNILPYIEDRTLHGLAADGKPDELTKQQLLGAQLMLQTAIDIINCPTRRTGRFPLTDEATAKNAGSRPASAASNQTFVSGSLLHIAPYISGVFVARSDYAANAGDWPHYHTEGPFSWQIARGTQYTWHTTDTLGRLEDGRQLTGISFQRSEVRLEHISDGTTHTYLCGEKYLNPAEYTTGRDAGDERTWAAGSSHENFRSAHEVPQLDTLGISSDNIFGSPHAGAWNVAFCDGRVASIHYGIDIQVHRNSANRSDGNAVGSGEP